MFKAPKNTSIFKKEPKNDKYVIQFAPELCRFIRERKKCQTFRYGDKYDYLKVGDNVKIRNVITKGIIGKAIITNKAYKIFSKLPYNNLGSHESYSSKEHQKKVLSGYYTYIGREICDDDPFIIFDFKLVK